MRSASARPGASLVLAANRDQFIELKGLALIAAILQNAQKYPEDCVLEAASILTTVATKGALCPLWKRD